MDNITEDEVERAIRKLKNNKAAGQDQITAELLKHGSVTMVAVKMAGLLNCC